MTINERVSDERIASVIETLEHYATNLKWAADHSGLDLILAATALRELQQYRAAAEPVAWMVMDSDSGEKILRVDRSNIEGAATPLYAAPQVTSVPEELLSAMEDVLRISDRDHDAWNRAKYAIAAIRSAPAVQAEQEPVSQGDELPAKCWCHTCRPVTMADMRFVVCPECGNKRCPHANDHRNVCTGSNEPGQESSAYPAAPHQEKE